ncbi:DMT family transporter [Frigoribacterium faeni]|uniref:Drug/metabolite transporter (DMT)-like permease n=1 Tax=Frigoribacterium faeni TaxID=145483 RepID=A0A7W3JJA6_9MICO|nr:DMT family transporter [Frigoribacterium faeni]MBA8813835.1 drug/metabolite transporter (DMT)-like permease [Frigoribacterium faeni]
MSKQIGVLGAVVTVLASAAFVASWSSGFVIAKIATVDTPATTLLAWRFAPLAVVLIVVALATGAFRGVSRTELRQQATIGLFAQFGYCAFVYAAVGAGIATGTTALIDAVQPLVVATLVGPLLGLRVRGGQWVGLALGAGGVAAVVGSQLGGSDASAAAYLLPAAAMACLIVGTFAERRAPARLPVVTTLTIHVSVTAAALIVLAVATGTLAPPAEAGFWFAAVLSAVLPTLVAYGLYWWLLRRVGITALNALLFLVAPTTALAGTALLGEPLTVVTVVGFALCASGVALVLRFDGARAMPADERPTGTPDGAGPDAVPPADRPAATPADERPDEKVRSAVNGPRLVDVSPSRSAVRPGRAQREAEEACRR